MKHDLSNTKHNFADEFFIGTDGKLNLDSIEIFPKSKYRKRQENLFKNVGSKTKISANQSI